MSSTSPVRVRCSFISVLMESCSCLRTGFFASHLACVEQGFPALQSRLSSCRTITESYVCGRAKRRPQGVRKYEMRDTGKRAERARLADSSHGNTIAGACLHPSKGSRTLCSNVFSGERHCMTSLRLLFKVKMNS